MTGGQQALVLLLWGRVKGPLTNPGGTKSGKMETLGGKKLCVCACVCVEGGGGGGACARACVRACLLTERIMQARCRSTARRFLRRCSMSRRSGRCALKQRSARRCRDTMRSAAQRMRGERQKETERDRERKNARPPPRAAAAVTPLRDRKTKTDGQRGGTVKWRGAQEQRRH